jgi:hypothetical protein
MESRRRWQRSKASLVRLCATAAAVAACATSASAHAEDSAYCRKVRARAAADAALLVAPRVQAEGIKAPSPLQAGGKLDPASPTSGYQVRVGASFSPLNFYKGIRVKEVSNADCEQHETALTAQQFLVHAQDLGLLVAFREQAAYLDTQRTVVETIPSRMAERFATRSVTLNELEEVRAESATLARQRAHVAGEIARIEATGIADYRGSIAELARRIHDKTMTLEREASHVRSIDAWMVNITGGYMPPIYGPGTSDFFGVVQVGYNLGGSWQSANEARYLAARGEELQTERYELGRQLELVRSSVKVASTEAAHELDIMAKRVAELTEVRDLLQSSEASTSIHKLDRIELELIAAQSDRVFLAAFVRELSRLEVN